MQNIAQILVRRAATEPHAIAYRFFQGAAPAPQVLTFHALAQQATALAADLQDAGLAGRRVLVACKSQQLFVIGFFACLLAGCTAVPTPPPRRKALAGRLQLLARDAGVAALIGDGDTVDIALDLDPELDIHLEQGRDPAHGSGPCATGRAAWRVDLAAWAASTDVAARAACWRDTPVPDTFPAFLQYTSGSTSDPKGVIVTHRNLVSNCAAIAAGMGFVPSSSILTALPLFHDMGLVGGVLESMYVGCIGNCMPPAEFVQYPERWLRIIAQFGITISGGPNFMYELAAQQVGADALAGCDLSAWEVAFCGAEPIRPATMARFTRQFAPLGLRPDAFYPCYGMAESTLFITGKPLGMPAATCRAHGSEVVDCGVPRADTCVTIVDPATRQAVAGATVGEIWVEGASVAAGYWRRPELSAQVFHATLANGGPRRFLRTGDLGYLRDGHLYVTGRLKDLIIVYGKNYAPHELEAEAEASHAALREAGAAAFSVAGEQGERVLLVCELQRDWLRRRGEWGAVAAAVGRAITASHGVTVDELVLIKPGSLPRTSSGKVRRQQCRLDYLSGALERAT